MIDGSNKSDNGCKMQMHYTSEGCGLSKDKEKKVLERALTHQLIVLENPPPIALDEIKIKQNEGQTPQSRSESLTCQSQNAGNFT